MSDNYFNVFVKSVIGAIGIGAVTGIGFTIKTLITYSGKLDSIENRIENIESSQILTNEKTNTIYNYFILEKHKQYEK